MNAQQTSQNDWPRRDAAVAALVARGEAERHVTDARVTGAHGHPGFCCCWMQRCRSDLCNVNAQIVAGLSTSPAFSGGRP